MKTLILTDNTHALDLARELQKQYADIEVYQSPKGPLADVPRLKVRDQVAEIIARYDLIISIHCKQLFPPEIVNRVRCVNVHPGLNPFNRGWFPQVFSILNGLPAGVTIHEMDEQLDHGAIIAQQAYDIEPWDTSGSAYVKIMQIERELVLKHFAEIRAGSYKKITPSAEGNVNYKKDYDALRELNLGEQGTFGDFVNRLRALTHDPYRNAYFIDKSGKKVFVRIVLEPES